MERNQSDSQLPFSLAFPSRADEVLTPAAATVQYDEKEKAYLAAHGIHLADDNDRATTTKSAINTPRNTTKTHTTKTVRKVDTMGGIDHSAEVSDDTSTEVIMDWSNDPGAADD